jgi:hypothetical protein
MSITRGGQRSGRVGYLPFWHPDLHTAGFKNPTCIPAVVSSGSQVLRVGLNSRGVGGGGVLCMGFL